MAPRRCLALSLLLLTGCGGDDGTGPGSDQPPTVTIQEVLLEGADQRDLRITGTATDDRGLDSLRFSVNGFHQFTRTVAGKESTFDFSAPGQEVGQGSAEVIAFDNGGQSRSATAPFEILEPSPTIDGEVLLLEGGEIKPAAGKLFCVEEVCDEVEADGSVWLEDLEWRSEGFRVHPIEGANPDFLVVPDRSRLEPNLVNYTNLDREEGREPTDTLLVDGVNQRRYLFFADGPGKMNLQTIIDNYTGQADCERLFRFLDDECGFMGVKYGLPGEKYKFVYPGDVNRGDTLYVAVWAQDRPLEVVDSLGTWIKEAIEFGQEGFEKIWAEPETYHVKWFGTTEGGAFILYGIEGHIYVEPMTSPVAGNFLWEAIGENEEVGLDRIKSLYIGYNGPWGMDRAKAYIMRVMPAFFAGSPHLAYAEFNTFMSEIDGEEDLVREWSTEDEHAYLFLLAFDHNTRFKVSEAYR
jgi:hypothetical protein